MTLQRYRKKSAKGLLSAVGYLKQQVFTDKEEEHLSDYIIKSSKIYFGLSPIGVRKLAFLFASKNNIKYPTSWEAKHIAGIDWFLSLMKRHINLSIRIPEATSLSRATSFNRTNVGTFF